MGVSRFVTRRPEAEVFLGSAELAKRLKISNRRLQLLDESKIVPVMQSGHRRHYTYTDAVLVAIASDLRKRKTIYSIQKMRKIFPKLRRELAVDARYLLLHGHNFHFAYSQQEALRLLTKAQGRMGIAVVDIPKVCEGLEPPLITRTTHP